MGYLRLALTVALVSVLAACSPYSYSKEVAAISTNVDKLSDAFTAGFGSLASDRSAQAEIDIMDARSSGKRVLLAPSCESRKTKANGADDPCGLYLAGTEPPALTPAEKYRKQTMDAVKVLKDYANALAAVTNAADRSAYDAAVAQLSGAVGTLLKPADVFAPGASVAVSAGINIFGWLVGTALDEQRYDTLKRAVTAVGLPLPTKDPPYPEPSAIRRVTHTLGDGLYALKGARLEILGNEVDTLVGGLNRGNLKEDAYRKRLTDAETALAVADGLRKADPKGAAEDLATAHDKLVQAVLDPKNNYTAFMKAVGDFADKVSTLESALKAVSPGATAKKGS